MTKPIVVFYKNGCQYVGMPRATKIGVRTLVNWVKPCDKAVFDEIIEDLYQETIDEHVKLIKTKEQNLIADQPK